MKKQQQQQVKMAVTLVFVLARGFVNVVVALFSLSYSF